MLASAADQAVAAIMKGDSIESVAQRLTDIGMNYLTESMNTENDGVVARRRSIVCMRVGNVLEEHGKELNPFIKTQAEEPAALPE